MRNQRHARSQNFNREYLLQSWERSKRKRNTKASLCNKWEIEREGRGVFEFVIVKERETNFAVYLVSYFIRQFCKFSDYEKGNLVPFGSVSGFHWCMGPTSHVQCTCITFPLGLTAIWTAGVPRVHFSPIGR